MPRDAPRITVVSGLPRSGTSMMMRMLAAGGMPVLADAARPPDEDNPLGYYELARVARLEEDAGWLDQAPGRVVKVVSHLLPRLPNHHHYSIVFMLRDMSEILASQRAMLTRRGLPADPGQDPALGRKFRAHLAATRRWLEHQQNMRTLYVRHGQVVSDPAGEARRVRAFLGLELDTAAMAAAVDPALHRQRAGQDRAKDRQGGA